MRQRPGSPWVYVYQSMATVLKSFDRFAWNLKASLATCHLQVWTKVRHKSFDFDRSHRLLSILVRLSTDWWWISTAERSLKNAVLACAAKATPTPQPPKKIFGIEMAAFNAPLSSLTILKLKLIGRIGSRRTVPQANVLQVFMQSFIYQNGRLLRLKK